MTNPFQRSPRTSWAVAGAVVGVLLGLFVIGNFGVASRGHGFGVWGWVICGLLGAYIGFRVGEWRHRRSDGLRS